MYCNIRIVNEAHLLRGTLRVADLLPLVTGSSCSAAEAHRGLRAMLSAGKLNLITGLKLEGVELRKAELDFHVQRYVSIGGVSSIMAGLTYIGVTKISIPDNMQPGGTNEYAWQPFMFYACSCTAMAISLFNLAISFFLVVNAQGLMLRGPPNSVVKCIKILEKNWPLVRVLVTLAVLCTIASANSIMWMKLDASRCHPSTEFVALGDVCPVTHVVHTSETKQSGSGGAMSCYDSYVYQFAAPWPASPENYTMSYTSREEDLKRYSHKCHTGDPPVHGTFEEGGRYACWAPAANMSKASLPKSYTCGNAACVKLFDPAGDPCPGRPGPSAAVSILVVVVVLASMKRMHLMSGQLEIPPIELVAGDITIENAGERINLIVEDEETIPCHQR